MAVIKVSDYIIKYIENLKVGHVFMVPGGGAMHMNDSLGKSEILQYVCCLHEQACAIAAEAYARVTNNIGVVMVTTGPGGTNALTGVAAAFIESTPMLVLSGQVKLMDQIRDQGLRQQGMQEVDIVSVVKPITKYAEMITDANQVKYYLDKAVYEATMGRKGPVWLDIPLDIQAMEVEESALIGFHPEPMMKSLDLDKKVEEVILAINQSERPVLLAGNGIRLAGAIDLFHELINYLNIPILTTWNGIDLIWEEHPMFFGRPGGMGQRYANFIQQNSDMFLSIGARLNLLQTGYNFDGFARAAKKIMVDIDEPELHKINVRPDIPICADAKDFMELLLKNKDKIIKRDRSDWINYAKKQKRNYPIVSENHWKDTELVNTYALLDVITENMKSNEIYVSGSSGTCIDISMQVFRVKKGQRVFSTKGLAAMGFGLPATIGACLAGNRRKTVCVNGDGGFQMNIQELETIHRLQLPIKIFVLNNNGYAQIYATQTNIFKGHYIACTPDSNLTLPSISKVAQAYGLKTYEIKSNDQLKKLVPEVLEYDGPVICEVFVRIDLAALPKQVSYKRKDGQMESKPLEYMNPLLPEAELMENMLIPLFKEN